MESSLSSLVNNLAEGIHKTKCKYKHNDQKYQTCAIKYKCLACSPEYTNFKNDLIEYKCLCCNKNYPKKFDEKLRKWLFNTYKLSNDDINNVILLLRKGVYPYEYSHLNMEAITDADYTHGKRVCKDFEIRKIGRTLWFVFSKRYIIISRWIWKLSKYLNLTLLVFFLHKDYHGKQP